VTKTSSLPPSVRRAKSNTEDSSLPKRRRAARCASDHGARISCHVLLTFPKADDAPGSAASPNPTSVTEVGVENRRKSTTLRFYNRIWAGAHVRIVN
jgi:hypothetical protein